MRIPARLPIVTLALMLLGIWLTQAPLQRFVLGLLPPAFADSAPVAEFVITPIRAVAAADASARACGHALLDTWHGASRWVTGPGSVGDAARPLFVALAAAVSVVASLLVAVLATLGAVVVLLLGIILGLPARLS